MISYCKSRKISVCRQLLPVFLIILLKRLDSSTKSGACRCASKILKRTRTVNANSWFENEFRLKHLFTKIQSKLFRMFICNCTARMEKSETCCRSRRSCDSYRTNQFFLLPQYWISQVMAVHREYSVVMSSPTPNQGKVVQADFFDLQNPQLSTTLRNIHIHSNV